MTDESWTKPRKRERGRFARNLGIVVVVLLAAGAALVGFSVLDRSALPSWIPPSVAQHLPDSSRLRRSLLASWSEARARFGPTNPLAPAPVSSAELHDYEFRLVKQEFKQGDAVVTVRLVHKPSGRAVPDAVIFARRIDMAPDGMPTMTAPVEPAPATDPGTYALKTNLMMEGSWRLSLAAKVQGEIGAVQNRLILKAVP